MRKDTILLIISIISITQSLLMIGIGLAIYPLEIIEVYQTQKTSEQTIQNKYWNLTITKNLQEELNQLWINNPNNEFGGCIQGYLIHQENDQGDNQPTLIRLTSITEIRKGDQDSITMPKCTTIARIHSHPGGTCKQSTADIENFKKTIKQGVSYNIIMCDKNKFAIYHSYEVNNRYLLELD